MRLPRLIAFDLDYTLWAFGAYGLSPPLVQDHTTGIVCDSPTACDGTESPPTIVKFHREVPMILKNLRSLGVTVATCSRTSTPKMALEALKLIRIIDGSSTDTRSKLSLCELELYRTDKTVHFKEVHIKTGLPYSEMLFFDDETRNQDVETLGVTFILVPEGRGMDIELLEQGIQEWRRRRSNILAHGEHYVQ
ncbi:hypothetical protein SCLCIDRAFT_1220986 [Scleroderma citrinum Foug A]|uniref:Magnesium-dependent phosphatase-1 n=1 Tax=Scleroderma citrinum Foug A TaxID=1036808 RepID=A0A0C3D4K1_9AGAM|nr:hypothetical protein SCLCIDRAFT_1220986 [Scleroderma citrinum Foug A]